MAVEAVNTAVAEESSLLIDHPPEDASSANYDSSIQISYIGKDVVLGEKSLCSTELIAEKRGFWRRTIQERGIKYIVAPMVDQSELAFRMMLRKYGAHLTFTPMIHAHLFVNDTTYRKNALSLCANDRPLIVQFCANNPATFLSACRLVEGVCDGVDLNLGCPQMVAKRGRYGSYLQDEVDLICEMVSSVRDFCTLPVSCKIRIRDCREMTKNYAKRLVDAGASMLTVHGRTREMKGADTGLADWSRIKEIVDLVDVPVVANGNIQMPGDVERCMEATGAVAVMSAEGILNNPLLFNGEHKDSWKVAREYLDYAIKFRAGVSAIRAHIFRICHHSMLEFADLRQKLGVVFKLADFEALVDELRIRTEKALECEENREKSRQARELFARIRSGEVEMKPCDVADTPHWIVKPYFRLSELARERKDEGEKTYKEQRKEHLKQVAQLHGISLKQVRKRERRQISMQRQVNKKSKYTPCTRCGQPSGQGCHGVRCKRCCRWVCRQQKTDCKTHRYTFSHLTNLECGTEESEDANPIEEDLDGVEEHPIRVDEAVAVESDIGNA